MYGKINPAYILSIYLHNFLFMREKIISAFFLLFFLFTTSLLAQSQKIPVTIDADQISFQQQQRKIIAEGNVVLEHQDVKVFCDKAVYDAQENIARIFGEAKIVRNGSTVYGKDIIYDFNTLQASVEKVRVSQPPIYGAAAGVKEEEQKYILEEGYVTTCDHEEPHYRLVAKKVTVYPGDRVVARNVALKVGQFPIFYFPYFSQSLKDDAFPIEISPGKSSPWGYYTLGRWRYNFDTEDRRNRGRIIFDWYEKRGQGSGIDHNLQTEKHGEVVLRYYRIRDELYRIEKEQAFEKQYPSRERGDLSSNRSKAQFFYNWQPNERFSLTSELHRFSDEYFMKDFFEQEYNVDPEPKSYLLATYSFDNSNLSLLAQKRVNRFFDETEYLPQLQYNFYRQQLGKSNFYFESLDKVGNLRETERNLGETGDAFRAYSKKVLSYRGRIGWLSLIPYGGSHLAYYSRDRLGERSVFRVAPKMGVTLNTRLRKTFDTSLSFFGERVDQIRHIFTPEVDYSNVARPSKRNDEIFQFDQYDDIEREQTITFRMRNKLQARNDERVWDFLYFSPAAEYSVSREGQSGGHFSRVTADLEIYPSRNISLNSDASYDVPEGHFKEVNADITFKSRRKVEIDEQLQTVSRPRYSVSLGHRYTRGDSSLGTLGFTYNLTPRLKFKNYIRYEYSSRDLEKQQYSLRFDLHCWWMDLGVDLDRHERGGKDTTIWLAFRLKAFPDINMDFSQTFDGAKTSY